MIDREVPVPVLVPVLKACLSAAPADLNAVGLDASAVCSPYPCSDVPVCGITGCGLSACGVTVNLETLDASGTLVTLAGLVRLEGAPRLASLRLTGCVLDGSAAVLRPA